MLCYLLSICQVADVLSAKLIVTVGHCDDTSTAVGLLLLLLL